MAKKPKLLDPVRPNLGIQAKYRRALDALIKEMHNDVARQVLAQYQETPPAIAQDAVSARDLIELMRQLSRKWLARFDAAAPELAAWFATATALRSDTALKSILRRAGYTVRFKMTPAQTDAFQATVAENVGLIKSISSEYLTDVQGLVMRSVTVGRDLGPLAKALQERYGVTKRRAALIARTQNNMATATLTRVRHQELGIEFAIWTHSRGGLQPRKTHLAAGKRKQRYKVAEGWFDPDPKVNRRIWPGELINCRCVARAVIPALDTP